MKTASCLRRSCLNPRHIIGVKLRMTISNCPACEEQVTVPQVSSDAIVQCPMCGEEYSIEQITDQLPPALIVISGSELPEAQPAPDDTSSESSFPKPGQDFKDSSARKSDSSSFSFDEQDAPTRPRTAASYQPRRAPQKKSPAKGLMAVILGGLLAGPIAQLILWHAFDKDPLGLAEPIGRISWLEWLVPDHRVVSLDPDSRIDEGDSFQNPNAQSQNVEPKTFEIEGNHSQIQGNGFAVPMNGEDSGLPTADEIGNEIINRASGKDTRPSDYVLDAPLQNALLLKVSIDSLQAHSDKWLNSRDEVAKEDLPFLERDLYYGLQMLARSLTFLDLDAPGIGTPFISSQELIKRLQYSEGFNAMLLRQSQLVVENSKEAIQPIVFLGRATEAFDEGIYSVTNMHIVGTQSPDVTVLYSSEESPEFKIPSGVYLVFGMLIHSPVDLIQDYDGEDRPVIVLGNSVPFERP